MRRRVVLELGWVVAVAPVLAHADSSARVTFMGFQTFPDQTSRIFVHLTQRPALSVEKQPTRLIFVLEDTTILVRNNKNPLNLEHFATPVKRANLVEAGSQVRVVIELKREVEARHSFGDNEDGTVTLQVTFPPFVSRT